MCVLVTTEIEVNEETKLPCHCHLLDLILSRQESMLLEDYRPVPSYRGLTPTGIVEIAIFLLLFPH